MFNKQQQSPSQATSAPQSSGYTIVYFVLQTWAYSAEVFLRRRFGARYAALQSVAVLVLICVWAMCWPGHDLRPLWRFLEAYVSACVVARINVVVRYWRGDQTHTRYSGQPRLLLLFRSLPEVRTKQFLEPLIVFLVGVFTCKYSQPLGGYLIIAAFCMFASVAQSEAWYRRRASDLHDAVIEQQSVAERFRNLRGEGL